VTLVGKGDAVFSPEIRYASSDDVYIAYQVLGHGPLDLVFVPGFKSHLEHYWEAPLLSGLCSASPPSLGSSSWTRGELGSQTGLLVSRR
jgi:hypothetical protein